MSDFSQHGGASAEWMAVQAELPPFNKEQSLEQLKMHTNIGREAVSSQEMIKMSPHLFIDDYSLTARDGHTLQVRAYRLKSQSLSDEIPLVVHLHGGGHLFGTLASEDAACARMALATGVCVLNVNYRHTPEAIYPTPWEDVADALVWLHRDRPFAFDTQKVILEGISAGAWMTASHVLAQRLGSELTDCPLIAGQILMIPCLVHYDCYAPQLARMASPAVSSKQENKNAPILSADRVALFLDLLSVKNPRTYDLFLNPGNATVEQARGLPPTVMGIAGLDPLRDEGLLYADLLQKAGVATDIHLFKGVPHGYRRFGDRLSLSKVWDEVISQGIQWILSCPQGTNSFRVRE